MTASYETMLYLAAMKMREFQRYQEIAKKHPDNKAAWEHAERLAINATAYCDAVADMFDLGYDAMYENAHKAAEAL